MTAQLMTALATTIQQQATAVASLQQQSQHLEAKVSAPGSSSRVPIFVDAKNLGRLEKFKGGKKDWQEWSFAFRAFLGGIGEGC